VADLADPPGEQKERERDKQKLNQRDEVHAATAQAMVPMAAPIEIPNQSPAQKPMLWRRRAASSLEIWAAAGE
jgi:hypothetical protein